LYYVHTIFTVLYVYYIYSFVCIILFILHVPIIYTHIYTYTHTYTHTQEILDICKFSLSLPPPSSLSIYIQGVRKFNRQIFRDCRGHHKNHFLQMNLGSEKCHYIATAYGVFERVGTSKYHKK